MIFPVSVSTCATRASTVASHASMCECSTTLDPRRIGMRKTSVVSTRTSISVVDAIGCDSWHKTLPTCRCCGSKLLKPTSTDVPTGAKSTAKPSISMHLTVAVMFAGAMITFCPLLKLPASIFPPHAALPSERMSVIMSAMGIRRGFGSPRDGSRIARSASMSAGPLYQDVSASGESLRSGAMFAPSIPDTGMNINCSLVNFTSSTRKCVRTSTMC
mmetsp:Transcript_8323/g.30968  ORF Transcript_8323/g.30968 Transcript_8323/m.30968 type:complete len:216 (-) Transcript_8323:933-1580(-)